MTGDLCIYYIGLITVIILLYYIIINVILKRN